MGAEPITLPDWDRLSATAASQQGLFTTKQAAEAGYSPQLLIHHLHAGKVLRLQRGIYRLIHFPPGEHEELVAAWLWSDQAGVLSHQTALALHGLSDALPEHLHLTLPAVWRRRRFRVPEGVVLHHADVEPAERTWFGAVPNTNPRRTLIDCAHEGLAPELLRQATLQAIRRGLVGREDIAEVERGLAPIGGLGA
jgi:predicted transcriptional regulator of viral defense system